MEIRREWEDAHFSRIHLPMPSPVEADAQPGMAGCINRVQLEGIIGDVGYLAFVLVVEAGDLLPGIAAVHRQENTRPDPAESQAAASSVSASRGSTAKASTILALQYCRH